MQFCTAERLVVWTVAILNAPRRQAGSTAGRTGIGVVADAVATAVGAGVRRHAVMWGGAERAILTAPVAELTNRTAMVCYRVRGSQQAKLVGGTGASARGGEGIAALRIWAALIVGRIADIDLRTLREEVALATVHRPDAVCRAGAKAEAVPRVGPADGLEADAPWDAVVVLRRRARGIHSAGLKDSLFSRGGACRLRRRARECIGAFLVAPIAGTRLADRITDSRRARRAGQGGRGTSQCHIWPRPGVHSGPGIPGARAAVNSP
jgi:hypothetical protein